MKTARPTIRPKWARWPRPGGEVLVVAGYTDRAARASSRPRSTAGAFDTFVLPDGMVGQQLVEDIGAG
jgi:branched-chain amino acid transport system substrate-binding protein